MNKIGTYRFDLYTEMSDRGAQISWTPTPQDPLFQIFANFLDNFSLVFSSSFFIFGNDAHSCFPKHFVFFVRAWARPGWLAMFLGPVEQGRGVAIGSPFGTPPKKDYRWEEKINMWDLITKRTHMQVHSPTSCRILFCLKGNIWVFKWKKQHDHTKQ